MEARLTGPAPEPDSKREKDFQNGTFSLMNTFISYLVKLCMAFLEPFLRTQGFILVPHRSLSMIALTMVNWWCLYNGASTLSALGEDRL